MRTFSASACAIALAVGILFCGVGARADHRGYDDVFATYVRAQLADAVRNFRDYDLPMTHEPFIAKLIDGGVDIINFTLQANRQYWIVDVCDQDCLDVDLELYDNNDNLIDSDLAGDDIPIVEVIPRRTDPFELVVTIPYCAAWRCTYGVGISGE